MSKRYVCPSCKHDQFYRSCLVDGRLTAIVDAKGELCDYSGDPEDTLKELSVVEWDTTLECMQCGTTIEANDYE